ncbi:putative monooxygenase [Atractiella rhizophila]|nr:putative monooxygenase [Atractiella rhizophila]
MAEKFKEELDVLIIGAGLNLVGQAGLSTALSLARKGFKKITVIEQAPNLGIVGVGIQCAPNMSRILDNLGIYQDVKSGSVPLLSTSIRRGTTDESLSEVDLTSIQEKYGYPHMVLHRACLIEAFYNCLVKEYSSAVTFEFNSRVKSIDLDNVTVDFFGSDKKMSGDLLIAGDGVKSSVRKTMLQRKGQEDHAVDTGQAAYRITLTREQMADDPDLKKLIEGNVVIRWISPKQHIICYPIERNEVFNISTVQPDVNFAAADEWMVNASKAQMLKVFSDYCPLVQKMLAKSQEDGVCEWKLRVHGKLDSWVEGNVALAGDACHATLPHLAQGAAQAIEDGAAIGVCLSKISSKSDVHAALKVYQRIRKSRAEDLVETAAAAGRDLHKGLDDAKERDERFKKVAGGGENPDRWADQKVQEKIYGHDVVAEAEKYFEEYFAKEKRADSPSRL